MAWLFPWHATKADIIHQMALAAGISMPSKVQEKLLQTA